MLARSPRVMMPGHRAPAAIPATPGAMQMSHVSGAQGNTGNTEDSVSNNNRGVGEYNKVTIVAQTIFISCIDK